MRCQKYLQWVPAKRSVPCGALQCRLLNAPSMMYYCARSANSPVQDGCNAAVGSVRRCKPKHAPDCRCWLKIIARIIVEIIAHAGGDACLTPTALPAVFAHIRRNFIFSYWNQRSQIKRSGRGMSAGRPFEIQCQCNTPKGLAPGQ